METFLKHVIEGDIAITDDDVARERDNQLKLLQMVP